MFDVISDWGNCVVDGVATLACLPVVAQNIINALVVIAGIVCVFLIIYSAYQLIMSEGNPEKVAGARKTLTYAIAGFIFVLLSFFLVNVFAQFTGVDQLQPK